MSGRPNQVGFGKGLVVPKHGHGAPGQPAALGGRGERHTEPVHDDTHTRRPLFLRAGIDQEARQVEQAKRSIAR
jgi:hypothetical protein